MSQPNGKECMSLSVLSLFLLYFLLLVLSFPGKAYCDMGGD